MKTLLLALLCASAAPARAEGPEAAPAPAVAPEAAPAEARFSLYQGPRFGLQLAGGLPSGAALQLVFRPWKFLRVGAGTGYNYLGMGVTGGLTLIPFHWYVTPTLGLEAGHFFPADASRLAGAGDAAARELLGRVGYSYLSADLGIEIGSENRFVFFVRAGLSELRPTVGDVNAALRAGDPSLRVTTSQPSIRARIPAVRIGFLVYVF